MRISKYNLSIGRNLMLSSVILLFAVLSSTFAQHRYNVDPSHRKSSLPTWEIPKLPDIKRSLVLGRDRAHFHGRVPRLLNTTCDINCQNGRTTKPKSVDQLVHELGYETLDMRSSVRMKTVVEVGNVPPELFQDHLDIAPQPINSRIGSKTKPKQDESEKTPEDEYEYYYDDEEGTNEETNLVDGEEILNRRKRNIFGLDTRFALPSKSFMTMYPFSTAVKLSTGCSGVLLSPKHVLTSAHCIHDGKRYVKGVKKLKVGKIMKKTQKKRGNGRKRNRKNRRGKKKQKKSYAKVQQQQEIGGNRARRDLSSPTDTLLPYFKWVRAKKTHIPQGWLDTAAKNRKNSEGFEYPLEFDYAVIELKRSLGDNFMDIGISPERNMIPGGHRIHFTGFDSDRTNQMLYRFCAVEEESPDLMYHFCDAQEGTSGSGIYIRLYDSKSEIWSRKVIGIFSGHQWVKFPDGTSKEYNTGVRITPLKYAQICFWTKGDYSQCRGG